MSVRLIACSQPVDMSPEEFIAYTARVSNPSNQMNHESAGRLLRYLVKHRHWSPFEMVSVTMEIKTSRDIARQILRHRSFSFQEFSQRYAEVTDPMIKRETRKQDRVNRQNSIETDDFALTDNFKYAQEAVWDLATDWYEHLLKNGVAKEQARALLPEGLTPSTLYMSGTLRSWLHYVDLRAANGTQKEHMEIAQQAKEVLREVFPNVMEMLDASVNE